MKEKLMTEKTKRERKKRGLKEMEKGNKEEEKEREEQKRPTARGRRGSTEIREWNRMEEIEIVKVKKEEMSEDTESCEEGEQSELPMETGKGYLTEGETERDKGRREEGSRGQSDVEGGGSQREGRAGPVACVVKRRGAAGGVEAGLGKAGRDERDGEAGASAPFLEVAG